MASPIVPNRRSIVTEALKKAGYPSPSISLVKRAEDEWLEETKHDIWKSGKKLKSMQATSVMITVENQNRYPYPSDYSSDLAVTLMHGSERGTAQLATSGTITLASTENITEEFILGKQILIYYGTAKANMSQCTAYNTTTKVATVNPDWVTIPDATSRYMIIDAYYPLEQKPIWDYNKLSTPTDRGQPEFYFPIGDSDNGEFILYKTPHHTSDIPFGMQLRYYADLLRLDLDSTLMATLYRRWRNEFMQGVYVRTLQDMDDSKYPTELQKYGSMFAFMLARETYGVDLSNLQATISA